MSGQTYVGHLLTQIQVFRSPNYQAWCPTLGTLRMRGLWTLRIGGGGRGHPKRKSRPISNRASSSVFPLKGPSATSPLAPVGAWAASAECALQTYFCVTFIYWTQKRYTHDRLYSSSFNILQALSFYVGNVWKAGWMPRNTVWGIPWGLSG